MASLYDAIEVKGSTRYRLNKNFVKKEVVPEQVLAVLTTENIVDENGMVIVDQKNDDAKKPTEENEKELGGGQKLARVDEPEGERNEGADEPAAPVNPTPQTQTTPPLDNDETVPLQVDDSANQTQEGGTSNDTTASDPVTDPNKNTTAPVAQAAPQPAPAPAPQAPSAVPQTQAAPQPPRVAEKPVEAFRSKVAQSSPGMGFPRKNGRTVDLFDLKTPHTHTKLVGGYAVPLSYESFKTRSEGEILNRLQELGFEARDFNQIEREQIMAGAAGGSDLLLEDEETDEDIQLG